MATLVFAIAVALIYVAAFQFPGIACGLVLSSYVIEQYAASTVPLAASIPPLCNYLTAGAVIIAVSSQVLRDGFGVFKIRGPGIGVLVLLAYCYATLLWSLFPSTTERLLRTEVPYLAVFVGLAPMIIQRVKDVEHALLGLIVGGTLPLFGLMLFGSWSGRSVLLLNGEESNPLALTQTAGSLLVAASLTDVVPKFFSKYWPIVASVIGITILLTFLRSASRGQVIAASGVTILFAAVRRGRWWLPFLAVALAGVMAMGFLEEEVQRNADRWDPERIDTDFGESRAGQATLLLKLWMNSAPFRIWFGLGNGVAQDHRMLGGYPHVVPAEVLAEEGIIGFCIYLSAIIASLYAYYRAQAAERGDYRNLILATSGLCVYEFMLTLKQGTLFGGASFLLLLVLPGALQATSWRASPFVAAKPVSTTNR